MNDKAKQYADSYSNLVSLMGTARDKSQASLFVPDLRLTWPELDAMYEQDAMAARVIDRLPDDATREGFTITAEMDVPSLMSEAEDLAVMSTAADGWRWARLYGGALIVLVVNDGLSMDQPIDLANATKLSALQIIEAPYASPSGFNPGLGVRAFRNPTHYNVLESLGATDVRRIHRTRAIRIEGLRVPPTRLTQNNGWPPSVLDRIRRPLTQLGSVMGYAENIMHNLDMIVLKIKGFRTMVTGSEESQQEARAIVESLMWNASQLRSMALDKEDELVDFSRTVTGLMELIDRFLDAMVRATDMPRTVLLGEQPGGLNANADSEIRAWYDFVASQQRLTLTPILARIIGVMLRIRQNNKERIPDEWTIEYPPLWQPTARDKAETLKTLSEAYSGLIMENILANDEARADLLASDLVTGLEMEMDGGAT